MHGSAFGAKERLQWHSFLVFSGKRNDMKIINYLLAGFIVLSFTSCVSQKKFQAALVREQNLMAQNATLTNNINDLNGKIKQLEVENGRLIAQIDAAGKNNSDLARMANMTQQQLQEEQKRLADLRRLMDQQRQALENLRQKMVNALVNFPSSELTVFTKNGRVYVSMQESLLFPSGSAVVNPKGREALGQLAQVLNANPDIKILVEGHTDSIPIRGKYEDNWALSVARSTSIVRILTDGYKVEPTRITASGRSKYEPVDTNDTPEGRAHNRRTEIILEPNLDELMRLINGNTTAGTTGGSGS